MERADAAEAQYDAKKKSKPGSGSHRAKGNSYNKQTPGEIHNSIERMKAKLREQADADKKKLMEDGKGSNPP
jgi:hypothetical protein